MFSPSTVASADSAGIPWVVVFGVVVVLIVLAIRYLPNKRRRTVTTTLIPDNVALSAKPILTDAEARFFRSLEKAVDGEYLVWSQLPLWTFIDIRSNDRGAAAVFENQINLKRVDFCLVDRQTHTVQKAIELDDRTHQRQHRQHRDAFVEDVLKHAGVALFRIPAARAYDAQVIRRQLGMDQTDVSSSKLTKAL